MGKFMNIKPMLCYITFLRKPSVSHSFIIKIYKNGDYVNKEKWGYIFVIMEVKKQVIKYVETTTG